MTNSNKLRNGVRVFAVTYIVVMMCVPILWNALMPRPTEAESGFTQNIEFLTQNGRYHAIRDSYQLCLSYCNGFRPNDTIWTALLDYPTNEDINWIDFEYDISCYYAPDNAYVERYLGVCDVQVLAYKRLSNNMDAYVKAYQALLSRDSGILPRINYHNPWLE